MKQIKIQQDKITELKDKALEFIGNPKRYGSVITFKAPTGSGKTYMMANAITKISKENKNALCFIWISLYKLHEQSKESLEKYFEDERLIDCLTIQDLNNNSIEENSILFINWESLNKKDSLFVNDNELNWNLENVVNNTKEEGKEIILLIDESHRNAETEASNNIIKIISPILTFEITATPNVIKGHLIDLLIPDVVEAGLIKKEVIINPNIDKAKEVKDLLKIALDKRQKLENDYNEIGKKIRPLLLLQIPKDRAGQTVKYDEYYENILLDFDIKISNGKLAKWLSESDKKVNLADITEWESQVEVLIFKDAIAVGWDCPRASVLFVQREWNSDNYNFNMQTLGRIMRMPELKHYHEKPNLNVGYVYTPVGNIEILDDLADNYATSTLLERNNDIYENIDIESEFVRREREKTRFSAEFKPCFMTAAKKYNLENKINVNVKNINFKVGNDGKVISTNEFETIDFKEEVKFNRDRYQIQVLYYNFSKELSAGYATARSSEHIRGAIRTWFKDVKGITNEDEVQFITVHPLNRNKIRDVVEHAKELYPNSIAEIERDEIVYNANWQIPDSVKIEKECVEITKTNTKSILVHNQSGVFCVKTKLKNKPDLSEPEEAFIEQLDNTDSEVEWWFKNGQSESKFFGIAYRNNHNILYNSFPDFIVKLKNKILVVEIKSDKDINNPINANKLLAGKDYEKRMRSKNKEIKFFMISPVDFDNFFEKIKKQKLIEFESLYERRLLKNIRSIQVTNKEVNKDSLNKQQNEIVELYTEIEKLIEENKDQKFKNELLEMELSEAQENVQTLAKSLTEIKPDKEEAKEIKIEKPFNICVLGEVSDQTLISKELNKYFDKVGVGTKDWNIEYFNNSKLQNSNVLRSLHKGQSKFSLIVTGQIFHHSGKGNAKANIISELKNEKYIPHCIGSNPKDLLTPEKTIEVIDNHLCS